MFPKNSRRPLTLDHKIRLKKQRSKALKSAGYSTETENSSAKRAHQNFKPRPADKIVKKLQNEKAERSLIQNVKMILIFIIIILMLILFIILIFLGKGNINSRTPRGTDQKPQSTPPTEQEA